MGLRLKVILAQNDINKFYFGTYYLKVYAEICIGFKKLN